MTGGEATGGDVDFVLGSGASLNTLTPAEVARVNAAPVSLALNKFLAFADRTPIRPRQAFLSDSHYPAPRVLAAILNARRRMTPPPKLFVHEEYRDYFHAPSLRRIARAARYRARFLKKRRVALPPAAERGVQFFRTDRRNPAPEDFFWADGFDEKLYFYRGSLTTAINIADLVGSATTISLLGVDMSGTGHFFGEPTGRRAGLFDTTFQQYERDSGRHATAVEIHGHPPIQAVFPRIRDELAARGKRLVCGNPDSLLVTEGILPHEPILSHEAAPA